jgi:hypothetical protein
MIGKYLFTATNISSFAAIIVDRLMFKSPYYEDGDTQKQKHIHPPDISVSKGMASFLDSQHIASAMEHRWNVAKMLLAETVSDTMSIAALNAALRNAFLIPVNPVSVHLVEKWQQTNG